MASAYVVLARKWRPAQFSDIVGQGHIVRTLMNAIRAERIHQAYLFTGSRGIGKTSIARIFAKSIRCEATRPEGDWLRSCDLCSSCKEIAAGNGVDVIEIDGASNNGVDAVREIRENARFLPSVGQRKIYIIDEVHMLTTAAFNALLKTLEEPPPHVIFIFATTEPHKIPATILSRCQRFDYRRVTVAQIQTRLAEISTAENIQAEPGALTLIARAAEGSMRDALSLLDQVIAFAGDSLTAQAVRESVGLIESQILLGILQAVFARKPLEALALVDQAYQRGHDLRVLTRSLIEFLHATILIQVGASPSSGIELFSGLSEEEWKELRSLAELRPLEEVELIFQVLHHGVEWIARSPQPKVVLDVLLVKCATAEALVYADQAGTPQANPLLTSATPVAKAAVLATRDASATMPAAPAILGVSKTLGARTWEGLIDQVRKTRPLLASILEHGVCAALPGTSDPTLHISFKPEAAYFREQLGSRVYHEQLITLAKEYFGSHVRLQLELNEQGSGSESLAGRKERELEERRAATLKAAQNHPVILEAKALFGGELSKIELTEENSHA